MLRRTVRDGGVVPSTYNGAKVTLNHRPPTSAYSPSLRRMLSPDTVQSSAIEETSWFDGKRGVLDVDILMLLCVDSTKGATTIMTTYWASSWTSYFRTSIVAVVTWVVASDVQPGNIREKRETKS